jgi:hypothetical protein
MNGIIGSFMRGRDLVVAINLNDDRALEMGERNATKKRPGLTSLPNHLIICVNDSY